MAAASLVSLRFTGVSRWFSAFFIVPLRPSLRGRSSSVVVTWIGGKGFVFKFVTQFIAFMVVMENYCTDNCHGDVLFAVTQACSRDFVPLAAQNLFQLVLQACYCLSLYFIAVGIF